MTDCSLPDCAIDALMSYRLRPYRVEAPICPVIERALRWPGVAIPTTVHACPRHLDAVKRAGAVLMAVPLGTEVATRAVEGEVES